MASNRYQRKLRAVSDVHCDDTAVEMDCVEEARVLLGSIRQALADGRVTRAEALAILAEAERVMALAQESLQYNVRVEEALTRLSGELSPLYVSSAA